MYVVLEIGPECHENLPTPRDSCTPNGIILAVTLVDTYVHV